MPRKSKRTQPVQTATGQPYGAAGAQADAQRQMPLPQSAPAPVDPMARAVEVAAPIPFTLGGFGADSEVPGEPVTAGLPTGPGPGPEALAMNRGGRQTSTTLDLIAAVTRDPAMAAMAARARAKGL